MNRFDRMLLALVWLGCEILAALLALRVWLEVGR